MPIDPRIILGAVPAPQPVASPMEVIGQVAQLQGLREQTEARRLAADKARQDAADQAAMRHVFAESGGDIDKALWRLYQINPRAAATLQENVSKARKETFEAGLKHNDLSKQQLDHNLSLLNAATPDNYPVLLPLLRGQSKELDALLPDHYDEPAIANLRTIGLTLKEKNEQDRQILQDYGEGKFTKALGTALARTTSQAEWDQVLTTATNAHVPKSTRDEFGPTWSPDAVKKAGLKTISPKEEAELAGQAATRAQTQAYQEATLAGAAESRAISRGQLGVAQAREAREAAAAKATGGVKLSPSQQEDIATMMTVQQLGQDALTLGTQSGWAGVGPVAGRLAPSLRGSGGVQGETLRNKIGNIQGTIAKLRGGTSFTPSEQKLLETYTPTITDTDQAIQAKLASLNDFIEKKRENTIRVAQGIYTLPAATDTKAAPPSSSGTVTVMAPNGKSYSFKSAAEAAAFKRRAGIP